MTQPMPTFAVIRHRTLLGYVTAVSYAKAVEAAGRRYSEFDAVELCTNRKARPSDRKACNIREASKRAVRYPTDGFEARRAALIAAHKANA
jgi:hypothetical protein